jgi:hypothetical protein
MENDTIRSSGNNTLIDLWVDGKMRSIVVTRGAIDARLGLLSDQAAAMSDEGRCEFVRTNLAGIMKAAKDRLREIPPDSEKIVIDTGDLGLASGGRSGERRKSDRREAHRPEAIPAGGDRRRGQRRRGDRRGRASESKQG